MEQSYTSGGQASGMERRQACRLRPLHLLLVFVCLTPVITTVPQVSKEKAQDLLWKGVWEDDRHIERAFLSGADLEERRGRWTPLTEASYYGRLEAVRELVRLGARLEGRGGWSEGTALYWASKGGYEAEVRLLLEAGASLEAEGEYGWTPLHAASIWGHLPVVRVLVEAGADINHRTSYGDTPLAVADIRGHSAVAAYLRSVGATT